MFFFILCLDVELLDGLKDAKGVGSSEGGRVTSFVVAVDTGKATSDVNSVAKFVAFSARDTPSDERLAAVGASERALLHSTSKVTGIVTWLGGLEESVTLA